MDEIIKACVKGMVLGKFELDLEISYCFLLKAGKYKKSVYISDRVSKSSEN